jgi:glycosyltransferase involved in cell wall biosynthesis
VNRPVFVDVGPLLGGQLGGAGRYAARLVEALGRRAPLRLVSLVSHDDLLRPCRSPRLLPGHEVELAAGPPPGGGDLRAWVRRLWRGRRRVHDPRRAADSPGLFTLLRPPRRYFGRELGVLHGFAPLVLPGAHLPETARQFARFCARPAPLCDRLLASSASARAESSWLCDVPPERVVVCHPGPSLCPDGHAWPGPVARRADVVLAVSPPGACLDGRLLLEWFAQTPALGPRAQLWWVGAPPPAPRGRTAPRQRRRVRLLGPVTDRALCRLYRLARCLVYPALYEGLPFPALDALHHGTPVVCSFNGALKELAGPGVFYFDVGDPASLDAAYAELLAAGPGPLDRPDLRERFSWGRLADTVLSLCG